MEKAKLYAQNKMVLDAKLAIKSALRHNIEAQGECQDNSKAMKILKDVMPMIKNGIKVNGKSILEYNN
jgi:hypothetical protein